MLARPCKLVLLKTEEGMQLNAKSLKAAYKLPIQDKSTDKLRCRRNRVADETPKTNLSSTAIHIVSSEKANLSDEFVAKPGTRSRALTMPPSGKANDSTTHGLFVCSETTDTRLDIDDDEYDSQTHRC